MKQTKALIINDIEKEPRTFEITSFNQMRHMEQEQQFELDLQDMEGFGSFYALLSYANANQEAIEHAVKFGATIEDVWVLTEQDYPFVGTLRRAVTDEEKLLEFFSEKFFDTSQKFCLVGEYKGNSYMETHKYKTCTAIFSMKEDAEIFEKLVQIYHSNQSIQEKENSYRELLQNRTEVPQSSRYKWEHL